MIAWDEAGSGPPLILVHGITEDRRAWDTVVPHLSPDFRCVRLDLRNHGESPDADDGTAMAMAGDVGEVVAAAGIDEPPLVIGHSLGGTVVTLYAAQAPVRGVVNVDQSLQLAEFAAAVQPLAPLLRGAGFTEALPAAFGSLDDIGLPPDVVRYLEDQHARARQDVVLAVWDLVLESTPEELDALVDSFAREVRAPYLAIHGADPGPGYAGWLAERIPGAQVEAWSIGGHYPHLADPARFARRVRDFASEVA
ncbi:MAG: alpha/beta fold hydrolase [Acidimicrobiia bacterium]|nr:alpha/beta fold hydrolase [Acidimicrobiia bacterium]